MKLTKKELERIISVLEYAWSEALETPKIKKLLTKIQAMIDAPPKKDKWMPLETIPTEGESFLVFHGETKTMHVLYPGVGSLPDGFTSWRPMPKGPK